MFVSYFRSVKGKKYLSSNSLLAMAWGVKNWKSGKSVDVTNLVAVRGSGASL
jgi:hypothetical protein